MTLGPTRESIGARIAAYLMCGANKITSSVTTPRPATINKSNITARMSAFPSPPAGRLRSVGRTADVKA